MSRAIKLVLLLALVSTACNRKLAPEVITEVRDTTIFLPSDTVYNTISIRELCDTVYKRDKVLVKKKGRITNTVTIKHDTIRFTCAEDSLRMVIETLRKTQTVTVVQSTEWKPIYIILLIFSFALAIFGIAKLVK